MLASKGFKEVGEVSLKHLAFCPGCCDTPVGTESKALFPYITGSLLEVRYSRYMVPGGCWYT